HAFVFSRQRVRRAAALLRERRGMAIAHDREQPRAWVGAAERAETAKRTQHRVLDHVVRVSRGRTQPAREAIRRIEVRQHLGLESAALVTHRRASWASRLAEGGFYSLEYRRVVPGATHKCNGCHASPQLMTSNPFKKAAEKSCLTPAGGRYFPEGHP